MSRTRHLLVLLLLLLLLPGCQRAYYGTMEKLGYQKRDILVGRVEKARDAQEAAGEEFRSALDRFREVVSVEGGDLEAKYETLRKAFDRSEARADAVSQRIRGVEDVSEALFDEWERELGQYSSASLRAASRQKLAETRRLYKELIQTMRRAEKQMDPVLDAFQDQVLFLKHNLNARAVASLRPELGRIEADVERLIREMEASIREADAFIRRLENEG